MKKTFRATAILSLLSVTSLTACMNKDTYYQNSTNNHITECKVISFGILYTIIAANYYNRCNEQVTKRGYVKITEEGGFY